MDADEITMQDLLNMVLAGDMETRNQAELAYNNLPLSSKIELLLDAIHTGEMPEESRLMAAVVLRRLLASNFMQFYNELPQRAKDEFLKKILFAVRLELTDDLRSKICEIVAEAARNLIDEEGLLQWPDFLQFLFIYANSPNPTLQETALRIFALVPEVFGNQQSRNYVKLIKHILQKSLNPIASFGVQFQAVRGIETFILVYPPIHNEFSGVLPRMIGIISESIQTQDDQTLVKLLIEIIEKCPTFLLPHINLIFEMCMNALTSRPSVDFQWRSLTLEVMVSFCEKDSSIVRNDCENYIIALIPHILHMLTDVHDDINWTVSDVAEDDRSDTNIIAQDSLGRLACSLGGDMILQHITAEIWNMLLNSNWKQRHAALMAISAIGLGCRKQIDEIFDKFLKGVLIFLSDPHPRVRYAACNVIAQMSTDFAPIFEEKFPEQVIPRLLSIMDDIANPRVQAIAGAALEIFTSGCPKEILIRYLAEIVKKLVAIFCVQFQEFFEKGKGLVLDQVLATIASVAITCKTEFAIYYDELMPRLKYLIVNTDNENFGTVRGKGIQCITLIALAAGRDKFLSDASEVMDILLNIQAEGDQSQDDSQAPHLVLAWGCMCKILGKQFEQYLPFVMDPVIKAAAINPDIIDDELTEDVDGTLVDFSGHVNITACMSDKASACEMLMCYAYELKEGFADYVEEVVLFLVPLLKYSLHDRVRSVVAKTFPYLINCGKIKGPLYLEGMWLYICPELLKAIDNERETDVLSVMLHSLAKSINNLGEDCWSQMDMNEVLRVMSKLMDEHFDKDNRVQTSNEEGSDDGVEDSLTEEDKTTILLFKFGYLVHVLFNTFKANFLPYFDWIAHNFIKMLEPSRPWIDRQWGLYIFDDLIEYCGPLCITYQHYFLQPMLQYVTDEIPEVRRAAAYGCGVLGQFAGEQFAVVCAQAIPFLVTIATAPNSSEVENNMARENAISAITKILRYNSSAVPNKDEIIYTWFSCLPVFEDRDEAPHIYDYFCDLIQSNHRLILGDNNQNVPVIVSIIADAFRAGVVSPRSEVGTRMVAILKCIEASPDLFQASVSVLTEEQKYTFWRVYRELNNPPT